MDLNSIEPLSEIKLIVKNKEYKGIILPPEKDNLILKLKSGYNLSFNKKNISSIEIIGKVKMKSTKINNPTSKYDTDAITIIHTGGTISSKVDYKTGAVSASFDPNTLLELFPELNSIAKIESEFIANILSDNFRFHHFNEIAKAIHKRVLKNQKKFIVTSGTDFLHYTSAALSFLLKDLPIAVLVVGSQRSSDRASSDAAENLINAAYFLENSTFEGVGVCMHSSSSDGECNILPGLNVRKMHSSRRDAFKPINNEQIATVNYNKKSIVMNKKLNYFIVKEIPKTISLFKENLKVGIIYSHPQFYAEELNIYDKFDGLVLAGSGLGNFPIMEVDEKSKEHKKIYSKIKSLAKSIPLVMSTQTISGPVNLNVYTPLRMLNDAGVIGHLSTMTTETSFIKLAYLLSTAKKEDIKQLFLTNILGELDSEKYFSFDE
ncbi:MAG: Glu-tRNA(Gln) amidotransferase subunit GatD [Candidatus Woesearchaeota archaeon]